MSSPGSGKYCECQRTQRLVKVVPPAYASSLLTAVLPRHARCEPEPASSLYWEEVRLVIEAIPPRLPVDSDSYRQLRTRLIPEVKSDPARTMALDLSMKLFVLSFLDAPRARMGLPDAFSAVLAGVVDTLANYFRQNRAVAQTALDQLVEGLSEWELADRVGLAIERLRLPFMAHTFGVGEGLLAVGALANRRFRLAYYRERLPHDFQCLSESEFNSKTRGVRDDPYLVSALLRRLPPQLGQAGRDFGRAVFGEEGHPESGRMALAFCCKNFVHVWTIMEWPRTWAIQCRLVELREWHVKVEDLDDLLIRNLNNPLTT